MMPHSAAAIEPYATARFNSLPEFRESKARFAEKRHVLDALGEVVRAHGAQRLLGAGLIHKHFPLLEGERIVETVLPTGSLLAPEREPDDQDLIPYLWHLSSPASGEPTWTPVEFVREECVPAEVRAFALELPERTELLAQLASVLLQAGAQDTFGLALLHRQFIDRDEQSQILLENPGPDARTLVVDAVSIDRAKDSDFTQTYWHFDIDPERLAAGCGDLHGCAGYCSDHGGGTNA